MSLTPLTVSACAGSGFAGLQMALPRLVAHFILPFCSLGMHLECILSENMY